MVVGIIIGASIFVQPTEVSRFVPSIPGIFAVWLAAGLLTLCGALVCAELSSAFPRTGGVYVFLKETISPAAGFLWVWAMLWSIHSGIIAATSVVLGRYLVLGDLQIKAVAIGAIWLLSAVNYLGVRQGSWLQLVVTTAKILAIGAILTLVALFGHRAATDAGVAIPPIRNFALAIGAGLFAFCRWHIVGHSTRQTHPPGKNIP